MIASHQRIALFSIAIIAIAISCNDLQAQDTCPFAGSWRIDLPKSSEIMTEEQWEQESGNLEEAVIRLSFHADKSFTHSLIDEAELTYTFEPIEDAENGFNLEVVGGPAEMKARIDMVDERTIRFEPEGFPPTILVKEIATLEEFKTFVLGKWKSDVEAIEALDDSGGWAEAGIPNVTLDFNEDGSCVSAEDGEPDPDSTFEVELGEKIPAYKQWNGQEFVIKINFGGDEMIEFKTHAKGNDRMTFELKDGSKLVFKRAK